MAQTYKLAGEARERAGKGAARALRRENKVPAVIYGDKKEPVKIALPGKDVNREYYTGHMLSTLCDIDLNGEHHQVLARDVQLDPVKDFVIHVDFLRVTDKTRLVVSVPVNFINEEAAPGIEEGGVLNIVRYEVDLMVRATNIPDHIDADLTGLNIGDALKVSDIDLPDGATPAITDRDFTIATIAAPRALVEEEPEEEEEEGLEGEEGEAAEGEEGEGGEEAAEGEEGKAEGEE